MAYAMMDDRIIIGTKFSFRVERSESWKSRNLEHHNSVGILLDEELGI